VPHEPFFPDSVSLPLCLDIDWPPQLRRDGLCTSAAAYPSPDRRRPPDPIRIFVAAPRDMEEERGSRLDPICRTA